MESQTKTYNTNPNSHFAKYFSKMRGQRRTLSYGKVKVFDYIVMALGSFLGIGIVTFLSYWSDLPLLAPSFGASAVLLYAACNSPLAQPRNVIGGHLISAVVGVLIYQAVGINWWSITLGVALAILAMALTHTLHPPGGATAYLAVWSEQGFDFIFIPIALGAVLLVLVALLTNNLASNKRYPEYWL